MSSSPSLSFSLVFRGYVRRRLRAGRNTLHLVTVDAFGTATLEEVVVEQFGLSQVYRKGRVEVADECVFEAIDLPRRRHRDSVSSEGHSAVGLARMIKNAVKGKK